MRFGTDDKGCFPSGRHYPGIAHLLHVVVTGLAEDYDAALLVLDLPIVAIDTETTGTDPATDRVVELACVRWQAGAVVARRSWLINPQRPIPAGASEVHGIHDDDVRDAPSFAAIAGEVVEALAGAVPLAYNASFDRDFIVAEFERAGIDVAERPAALRPSVDWLDPLTWARELQRYEKGKTLGEVAQRLGIAIDNAHRATDDAEAAVQVLLRFLSDERVPRAYGAFIQEQRRLGRLFDEQRARWRTRA